MQAKKQQLEPDVEQQTASELGKEYVKAIYCHLTYLTYMQSECENRSVVESHMGLFATAIFMSDI